MRGFGIGDIRNGARFVVRNQTIETKPKSLGFSKLIGKDVVKAIAIKNDPKPYVAPVAEWPLVVANFPNCCGALIVHGFPGDYNSEAHARVKKYIDNYKSRTRTGMSFATLAEYQFKFEPILLENGWKATDVFINPNHMSKVKGYYLDHGIGR